MPVGAGDALYITLPASADLSAKQFCCMKVDTSGYAAVADGGAAIPEHIIGVLQNKPDAAGKPAVIQIAGISKVYASAALATIGVKLSSTSDGYVDAAGATDIVVGILLEAAGAAGDIVTMIISGPYEFTTAS